MTKQTVQSTVKLFSPGEIDDVISELDLVSSLDDDMATKGNPLMHFF
jgi:hypothetical protein